MAFWLEFDLTGLFLLLKLLFLFLESLNLALEPFAGSPPTCLPALLLELLEFGLFVISLLPLLLPLDPPFLPPAATCCCCNLSLLLVLLPVELSLRRRCKFIACIESLLAISAPVLTEAARSASSLIESRLRSLFEVFRLLGVEFGPLAASEPSTSPFWKLFDSAPLVDVPSLSLLVLELTVEGVVSSRELLATVDDEDEEDVVENGVAFEPR